MPDLPPLRIPNFGVPASTINPLVDEARAHTDRWVCDVGLIRSEAAFRRFTISDLGGCGAHLYPGAPREHLLTASDMLAWLMCFDDNFDDGQFRHEPLLVEQRLRETLNVLLFDDAPQSAAGAALRDIFTRMTRQDDPAQRRRCLSHFAAYFEGILQESRDRALGRTHDFANFIERRRFAAGVLLCLDFIETVHGLHIPDQVHATLEMHLLFNATSDVTHWMSDVTSLARDQHAGQANLLLTLRDLAGSTLQDAADHLAMMISGRMELFDETVDRLPFVINTLLDLNAETLRQTRILSQALKDWISGFGAWITDHPRYMAHTTAAYQTPGYIDESIFDISPRNS